MPRDILSEYGPERPSHEKPRATNGGKMPVRDVMGYNPPKGPTNIMDRASPGLHGNNYGVCGTQGPKATPAREGGSPGLHGANKGYGTNRK